jgi:hypothetical protein
MAETVQDALLLAARKLDATGNDWSAEDLAVSAWEANRDRFGLAGYGFPDNHKVNSALMGARGLVRRGYLVQTGPKRYRLSTGGRERIAELTGERPTNQSERQALSARQEKFLQRLLGSVARHKFDNGLKAELTFADACYFWSLIRETGEAVDLRLKQIETTLIELAEVVLVRQDGVLSTGRVMKASDCRALLHLHAHLQDRFARLLCLLRSRTHGRNTAAAANGTAAGGPDQRVVAHGATGTANTDARPGRGKRAAAGRG